MHSKMERRCVACRNPKQQQDMLRLAKINNTFHFDFNNKLGGRGAYVCKNINCINATIKKRLFNKSFKQNINIGIYEQLEEYAKDM